MMRLTAFSLLLLSTGCAGIPRPNAYGCIVNAPAHNRKCYNFATDYDADGRLIPGAKATYRQNETLDDLNKAFILDAPDGFENGLARMKAYIKKLRDEYEQHCSPK